MNNKEITKEFEIKSLNQLSFPKTGYPLCDLTNQRASVQLITKDCTLFYANYDLAEKSYYGIIHKVSNIIGKLNETNEIVGTIEERQTQKKNIENNKKKLIAICLNESSKLMSINKHELAIPAAILALKYSKQLEGEKSLLIVEPNLHLGQAFLSIKEYSKALENLSLARWIVLNHSDCPDSTLCRLHMLLGRVNTAQGHFEESKDEFANAIYHSSCYSGPESVATSMGYYRLGDVFLALGSIDNALAYFDKVVDIWYKYLSALHHTIDPSFIQISIKPDVKLLNSNEPLETLSDEFITDGRNQLEQIYDHRKRILGARHIAVGEVEYTIGLFEYFLLSNVNKAEKLIAEALGIHDQHLGNQHATSLHIKEILKIVRKEILKDALNTDELKLP